MAQVINTNSLSLLTQNNLSKSQSAMNTAIQRLSSGMRINSAKDDAAGQAIGNRFTANIRGLTQAQRNANDGISLSQTTEGALNEVNNNLQRIRELTVQAANGSNSAADKVSIQGEISQRLAEIDRTSAQTDFNGVKVLSSNSALVVQVGSNDGEQISIALSKIDSGTLGLTGFNVDGSGSPNTGATAADLLVAGLAKGTTTNGVTTYARTLTTAVNGATSADILPTMQTSGTVAITGGATYTYDATAKSYTGAETARTQANTLTSITPAAGTTASATIKLGTASTNVNVDSNGTITAADGSALYLDASNNLTATGSGTTVAATLANVLDVTNGMSTVGDSITFNATGTKYTAGVIGTTGNNTYNVTGELASESVVAASIAKTGGTITDTASLGTSYTISAGGVSSNAFMGASGLTKTAAETLFLNANGVVTDSTANKVYADSTNPGKLTIKAASDSTATVDPLKALDAALSKVDGLRGTLGAVQNRFDSVIANLGTTITNLTSSRSRIEDADYATEVSNMTRAQILQQAGTSVLAKANQSTQGVMALLQ